MTSYLYFILAPLRTYYLQTLLRRSIPSIDGLIWALRVSARHTRYGSGETIQEADGIR